MSSTNFQMIQQNKCTYYMYGYICSYICVYTTHTEMELAKTHSCYSLFLLKEWRILSLVNLLMNERFFLCSVRQTKGSDSVNCVHLHRVPSPSTVIPSLLATFTYTPANCKRRFSAISWEKEPMKFKHLSNDPQRVASLWDASLMLVRGGNEKGTVVSIVDCLALSVSVPSVTLLTVIACLTLEHMWPSYLKVCWNV